VIAMKLLTVFVTATALSTIYTCDSIVPRFLSSLQKRKNQKPSRKNKKE